MGEGCCGLPVPQLDSKLSGLIPCLWGASFSFLVWVLAFPLVRDAACLLLVLASLLLLSFLPHCLFSYLADSPQSGDENSTLAFAPYRLFFHRTEGRQGRDGGEHTHTGGQRREDGNGHELIIRGGCRWLVAWLLERDRF